MQKLGHQDAISFTLRRRGRPCTCARSTCTRPIRRGHRLTFDEFREHVRSRLPLARGPRRRLDRVPLDLDYPYWVEDRDFDLDHHV